MHENSANIRKHGNNFVDLPFEKLVDFRILKRKKEISAALWRVKAGDLTAP